MYEIVKKISKWILRKTYYHREVYVPKEEEKPFFVRLDVTNTCNLKCKMCFYPEYIRHESRKKYMSLEEFRIIADKVLPFTYSLQLSCSFESMMHPDYAEIIRGLDKYDIFMGGTVTNGTLLNGERAEALLDSRVMQEISVSIDTVNPDVYKKIRGRDMLGKVLKNLEDFQNMKRNRNQKNPKVKFNAVMMRSNIREFPDIVNYCADLGIDALQSGHVEPYGPDNEESLYHSPQEFIEIRKQCYEIAKQRGLQLWFPPPMEEKYYSEKYKRYVWTHCVSTLEKYRHLTDEEKALLPRETAIMLTHPYPKNTPCISPWMTLQIDAFGNVAPCGYRGFEHNIGNLIRQNRMDVINSIKVLKLRKALLDGRKDEVCTMCMPWHPYADPFTSRMVDVETLE